MRILFRHGLWQFLCISFFFFFFLHAQFITSLSSSETGLCPHDQSIALLQFKNMFSTDVVSVCDHPETNIASWNEDVDCCSWSGVTCEDETGNVIGLQLSCGGRQGTIHSNSSLFLLSHLQRLNLAYNDFERSQISPKFENNLTGEIPTAICHVKDLQVLDLSHNNLAGKIPHCLGNLSKLLILNLRMNRFEDTIPEAFGSNLRRLSLNGNKIGGSLPMSLLNCSKLQVLDVGSNKLDDIFPQWLESLAELQLLVLRSNKFHGDVRGSNANKNLFSKLKIFDLSRNNFNGPPTRYIENFKAMMNVSGSQSDEKYSSLDGSSTMKGSDIEMVKMFTPFAAIDLSYNKFEGEIPKVIGELKSLSSLSLSHNSFTGQIPASTGQLTGLEWLDLSYNHLSGEIPIELENLTFLSYLDLSWNNLTGPIPKRRQFGTFGNESYEGNMGLCGFPLTNRCRDDEGLEPPPLINFQQEAKRVFLLLSVFGFVLFFICTI